MATSVDVTVSEYGFIEDAIEARIRDRERLVNIESLLEETGISAPKIEEAMAHMTQKYDHISRKDVGEWEFELPE